MGAQAVCDAKRLAAVVNCGDDIVLHGLHISPDIDTIIYTLAGRINPDTGWGLRDETWQAMGELKKLGARLGSIWATKTWRPICFAPNCSERELP